MDPHQLTLQLLLSQPLPLAREGDHRAQVWAQRARDLRSILSPSQEAWMDGAPCLVGSSGRPYAFLGPGVWMLGEEGCGRSTADHSPQEFIVRLGGLGPLVITREGRESESDGEGEPCCWP